jgi:hypothetical protein
VAAIYVSAVLNAKQPMSIDEARRAIYIDFEGCQGEEPALLGVLYAEGRAASEGRLVLRQDVVDSALRPLVGFVDFGGYYRYDSEGRTIRQAVADVCSRARHQRRCIVSWSRHDADVIAEYGRSRYNQAILNSWYRDGKATARRWKTLCHPEWDFQRDGFRGANQLTRYLEAIGYDPPADYGKGAVGDRIRAVRRSLQRRGSWDDLPSAAQDKWVGLLSHNSCDLDGMREVVLVAAAALANRSALR